MVNRIMIYATNHTVSNDILMSANKSIPADISKFAINEPTGDFFYDKWTIKQEFKNTVWDEILKTIPEQNIGEARIINLDIKTCYTKHADIDDRWHLSFGKHDSFLVDLESNTLHQPIPGIWYSMNAGLLHSAVNFGDTERFQLVVRKLLLKSNLKDPINVKLFVNNPPNNYRYVFDQYISSKLNRWNKEQVLTNFSQNKTHVEFNIEKSYISQLEEVCKKTKMDIDLRYDRI